MPARRTNNHTKEQRTSISPRHAQTAAVSMQMTAAENQAMALAVKLAAFGAGTVLPNPVVGCVLMSPAGEVVGRGWHQRAGGPHAEVVALTDAGDEARGATAILTLEPCNHTDRTGPCSLALIAAGVAKVIVAVRDPWPTAAGGIEALRDAGVEVLQIAEDDSGAEDVNRVWLTATRKRRAFVTFKTAMTIDARVAATDGTSQWITSPESRADVQRLRGEVDAIMVGVGTVLADDPLLTVRDIHGTPFGLQPLRVVIDSSGRTPPNARVRNEDAETLIATSAHFGHRHQVDVKAGRPGRAVPTRTPARPTRRRTPIGNNDARRRFDRRGRSCRSVILCSIRTATAFRMPVMFRFLG